MKKKLSSYTAFIGFLSLIILLTLTTFVQAQNIEKWTGPVSFTLKLTTTHEDTSGNRKFVTSNETFNGTMNFYFDPIEMSPTPGPDGCIVELLGSDGTQICFNEIIGTASRNIKTGKHSILSVGTGYITTTLQGQEAKGIIYINGKGSDIEDSSQNLISFSVGGAVGGGYSPGQGEPVIFSGTIPTTALSK